MSKQTITITPAENGWLIHVNEPSEEANLVANSRVYVAVTAGELAEIIEDLAHDCSSMLGAPHTKSLSPPRALYVGVPC